MHMTRHKAFNARGFSLIEVLVSVVIMSIGLVALAALQLSLIRSSSDTKAQSIGLALGKQQIEKLRSFQLLDTSPAGTGANPCNSSTNTTYIALDTCTVSSSAGGVSYSVVSTIARYALVGSSFISVPNTDSEATVTTNHSTFVPGRDFKKATVKVSWTDSTGTTNSVTLNDVIDGLSPADSAKVVKNTSGTAKRNVQVIITNPSNTAGVIPIAIGDSTDTAATNPKPVVNSSATETRFNIYTYSALAGGTNALAQSEVETNLIGCTCDTATKPTDTTSRGYRPTYWNGYRYVAPTLTTYVPTAGQSSSNASSESPYCDICCRDHYDPSGTTTPKFDPWRTTHTHYGLDSSGNLVAVGTSGQTKYLEACRLIRVDGIFRVAADYNDEYFNLLKTKNDGSTTEYAPDDTAVTNYQSMVLSYLNDLVVNNSSPSTYNTPLAASTVTSLEATNNINDPTSLSINRTNDHKWLHSRGLYIDYLEADALSAIADAKTSCVTNSCSSTALQTAVLSLLPFTSINLTELSNWTPLVNSGQYISVSNGAFSTSTGGAPIRGYAVSSASIPATAQTANAISTIRDSNSGLQVLYNVAIDPDETSKSDTQAFAIPASGGSSGGGNFTVAFSNYGFGNTPQLSGTNITQCTHASTNQGTATSPYTCSASSLGSALTLTAGNYNYKSSNTSKIAGIDLTCTKSDGTSPLTLTTTSSNKPAVYTCNNYKITGASSSASGVTAVVGSATNDGLLAESTPVSFSTVSSNDVLTLTFATDTTKYGYTCTYTSSISDAVVTAANCN
jgi:type IV pilus modification protein PilV